MARTVWAVVPPDVMTPDGRYGDGWKAWCETHNVSLLAFAREAERRRARTYGRRDT